MDELDVIDQQAGALLAQLAHDPESDCSRQFDALLYEIVWRYLRANGHNLATRVARHLGIKGAVAPQVLFEEIDEVAHDATTIALRRVREKAAEFDPAAGTPTHWAIGCAQYAYVEVAKEVVTLRRSDALQFVAPDDLLGFSDSSPTTEEHVLRELSNEEALKDAADHTTEAEFAAIRLVVTLGYSYAETAEMLFGDATHTRRVDGLLTRGKAKLAVAWSDRRPSSSGTVSGKVSEATDDGGRA